MSKKKPELGLSGLESALNELEQLTKTMEGGNLSLEQALTHFERGITLTRICQQALLEAEQKVEILLQQNGSEQLAPFEQPTD